VSELNNPPSRLFGVHVHERELGGRIGPPAVRADQDVNGGNRLFIWD
jgi:hypothetical protein